LNIPFLSSSLRIITMDRRNIKYYEERAQLSIWSKLLPPSVTQMFSGNFATMIPILQVSTFRIFGKLVVISW
jgi:hypothetical protein